MTQIVRMVQRLDTTARWTLINPVLAAGEFGFDTTLERVKVGDGVTAWVDLLFVDNYVAGAEIAAAQAAIAQEAAQTAADAAAALVLSDLGTTDGQTRALVQNPLSQTAIAISTYYDLKPYAQHPSRVRDAEYQRGVAPYFNYRSADWQILRTVTVADDAELTAALTAALPGDEIVVTGNLTGNFTADWPGQAMATERNPIIIRAERQHAQTFAGTFTVRRGRYVYFVGFDMGATGKVVMTGTDGGTYCSRNRVVGCRKLLTQAGDYLVSLQFGASYNQGLFNELDGSQVTSTNQIHGFIVSLANDPKCLRTYGNRFAYNWFHDFPVPEVNDCSTIWLGQGTHSTTWDIGTVVEYNLFERCLRDDEIISIKSSGNTIRYNEFRDMLRSGDGCWLTLRHGYRNVAYNNLMIGCAGIRIWGEDHTVSGNTLVGGAIEVQAGDTTEADLSVGFGWPACRRVRVIGNHLNGGEIRIGNVYNVTVTVAAADTTLSGNTDATIVLGLQTGTVVETTKPKWNSGPLATLIR